jgi:hypothetical protein
VPSLSVVETTKGGAGTNEVQTLTIGGIPSVSGYTLTMPTAGEAYPFVGGRAYIVNVTVTLNSETVVKYFRIRVRKDESMA